MLIPVFFFFFLQPFNNWLDGAKEDLLDIFIVHSVEEIQVIFNLNWSSVELFLFIICISKCFF